MSNCSLTRLLLHKTSRTFNATAKAWDQQYLSKWKATLKNAEQHSKHRFVRMMPVNGCFIVELLRELKHNFQCDPFVKRWMLPILRWDLIMLENQLPLFVLQKLFELTKGSEETSTCLEQLALCFFNPLLQSQRDVRAGNAQGIQNTLHFLDLFRKRYPVSNMVAYEQCHPKCKPYVTSYIYFFDGLIKSAEDVGLLHHIGVLRHCLGSNKEVAKLVNGLCKEIARDGRESYLCKVVDDMNTCCNGSYAWFRAGLVHHYFWVVGISTLGATIVVYFSLIQRGFVFVEDQKNLNNLFHYDLICCVILSLDNLFFSKIYNEYKNKIYMYSI
ncbi:hypothetical protein ES319_A03G234100v1 [Gossypium barbadense]|uniref:Uncharacterized protein n=1 Tax=Gossypium barbadense TaxID=3634 RepID=A0A5J5WLA7_GOSBA|nr:hypothetical protein ES319_A03G234100v1 [Gossypium barbadense]